MCYSMLFLELQLRLSSLRDPLSSSSVHFKAWNDLRIKLRGRRIFPAPFTQAEPQGTYLGTLLLRFLPFNPVDAAELLKAVQWLIWMFRFGVDINPAKRYFDFLSSKLCSEETFFISSPSFSNLYVWNWSTWSASSPFLINQFSWIHAEGSELNSAVFSALMNYAGHAGSWMLSSRHLSASRRAAPKYRADKRQTSSLTELSNSLKRFNLSQENHFMQIINTEEYNRI